MPECICKQKGKALTYELKLAFATLLFIGLLFSMHQLSKFTGLFEVILLTTVGFFALTLGYGRMYKHQSPECNCQTFT